MALPLSAVLIVSTGPVSWLGTPSTTVGANGIAEGLALLASILICSCLALAAYLYDA